MADTGVMRVLAREGKSAAVKARDDARHEPSREIRPGYRDFRYRCPQVHFRHGLAHCTERGFGKEDADGESESGADDGHGKGLSQEECDDLSPCRAEGAQDADLLSALDHGDRDGIIDQVHAHEDGDETDEVDVILKVGDEDLDLFCPAFRRYDTVSPGERLYNAVADNIQVLPAQEAHVDPVDPCPPCQRPSAQPGSP